MVKKIRHQYSPVSQSNSLLTYPSNLISIKDAIALHRKGMLSEAQAIYRYLIKCDPQNSDALNLLGMIASQTNNHQECVNTVDLAIEINPNVASYHFNRGNALNELKQFEAAVESYGKAIIIQPGLVEAHSNQGNALFALKRFHAALTSYEKAISLKPDTAEVIYNQGNAFFALNKFHEAIESYDKAISIKPAMTEAFYNRGNALQELKNMEAAVKNYDIAISLNPNLYGAHSNRGKVLRELKQLEAAITSYDIAIALNPNLVEAHINRGNALQELNHFEAAIASYDKAISLKPDLAEAYSNRGNALRGLNQFDYALANFDKAISLKNDYAEAYFNKGNLLFQSKQFEAAVVSYDAAIKLKPDYAYLYGILQYAKMCSCDWYEFDRHIIELRQKIYERVKVSTCLPVLAMPITLAEQRQVAEILSADKFPYNPILGAISKPLGNSKIRIGYYSADFHAHPVSFLTVGLFELHDRKKFELIAFSFGPYIQDEIRCRITNAFDRFIDVKSKSDQEVAAMSREFGVNIAVDLSGYTNNSRTGIFSFRAAPIQVSYIGYLGSMAAPFYDYLIADKTIIPVNSQSFYSEKIVYLPSYQVNDSNQQIPKTQLSRHELNLPSSGFIYCCFNANYKITPTTFSGWMRILKAVPLSFLLLYSNSKSSEKNLCQEAENRGIDSNRLIFCGRLARSEYLARCRSVDLFLDTLPYNAGATASDALWAGLPVLTCMGESFASRYAASLLYAMELPELVTESQEDYEDLAIELGTNPVKLKEIKNKLEGNRLTTPLFDTALFTKHIEAAYTKMFEHYIAELPLEHIYIDASN